MISIGGRKKCTKCGEVKPIGQFGEVRSKRSGRRAQCKACWNATRKAWRDRRKEHVSQKKRESYQRNREAYLAYMRSDIRRRAVFRWKLENLFGITLEQYEQLAASQGGCCAICGKSPDEAKGHKRNVRLHIDHDHDSGLVRGLLCNTCNTGLGCFYDSLDNLIGAIEYLERFRRRLKKDNDPEKIKPTCRDVQLRWNW